MSRERVRGGEGRRPVSVMLELDGKWSGLLDDGSSFIVEPGKYADRGGPAIVVLSLDGPQMSMTEREDILAMVSSQ